MKYIGMEIVFKTSSDFFPYFNYSVSHCGMLEIEENMKVVITYFISSNHPTYLRKFLFSTFFTSFYAQNTEISDTMDVLSYFCP